MGNGQPFSVGMAAQRHAAYQSNAIGILSAKKQPALYLSQVQAAFLIHEPPFFSEPK